MLAEERYAIILEQVRKNKSAKLPELCELLNTSESTVRRDLAVLDDNGLIRKVHGGAVSVDQYRRIENVSWWKEEMPSKEEFKEAKENLLKYNNQVDYIITHTCDAITIRNYLIYFRGKVSEIFMDNEMLDYFETNVKYKHWYFGHYHFDGKITDNKTEVYNSFYELR